VGGGPRVWIGVERIQRQTEEATMGENTEARVLSNVVRIDEEQVM
jgi:hypothetical protein